MLQLIFVMTVVKHIVTSLELFIDKCDTYTRDVKGLVIKVNFFKTYVFK